MTNKMRERLELLEELIKVVKSNNISCLQFQDIKLTFLPPKAPETPLKEAIQALDASPMPSDQDMLYWSTGEELPSDKLLRESKEE